MFDEPLVFVDIETTGLSSQQGRVIEVAAIRVEKGVITSIFDSLVDPETPLPHYISSLTGITQASLESAPPFRQIAGELRQLLDGAIFVAHNVRFDYSFLKQEYKRLGETFLPRQLCTVRLSRAYTRRSAATNWRALLSAMVLRCRRATEHTMTHMYYYNFYNTLRRAFLRKCLPRQSPPSSNALPSPNILIRRSYAICQMGPVSIFLKTIPVPRYILGKVCCALDFGVFAAQGETASQGLACGICIR